MQCSHAQWICTHKIIRACMQASCLAVSECLFSNGVDVRGKWNAMCVCVRVFCLSTFSPPNYTTSPFMHWKEKARSLSARFEKEPNLCESLRAQNRCHTIQPRRTQHKRGRRLQIKHLNQLWWVVDPWERGIRFQGNVSKIGFLEALSLDDCKTVSRAKATALTWTRSVLSSNYSI